jgi:hypothetical protein
MYIVKLTAEGENIPLEHLMLNKNLVPQNYKNGLFENKAVEKIVNDMLGCRA